MATFMDLPRDVREKIYRLHLVRNKPITNSRHHKILEHHWSERQRSCMPALFEVSAKIEKEAAPIYYGENHFDLGEVYHFDSPCKFFKITPRRHLKFLRMITCTWAPTSRAWTYRSVSDYGGYGSVGKNWQRLSTLKNLVELNIRVDEADIINNMKVGRGTRQYPHPSNNRDLTPQESLAIFRFPSVTGLLSISGIQEVKFIAMENESDHEKYGGPVPGGPLETHILPRLKTSQLPPRRFVKKRPFRFLDLPPELRNRVYDLVMRIDGPVHPSKEAPTTAAKNLDNSKGADSSYPTSALNMLLVNKQIQKESIGLFYNANAFVFYYPVQLNAFLLTIGEQRQRLIRDVTIDYYNMQCGGIDLIDLTFALVKKQLIGLRRLHIVMKARLHETTLRRGWMQIALYGWKARLGVNLLSANPNLIPGVKHLFELRGIHDIKIRDVELEEKVKEMAKEPGYPDFANNNKHRDIMQLSRAYEHFNLALAAAQQGNVNDEVLTSIDWHTKETFPKLEIEDEVEEEGRFDDGNASDDESALTELSDRDFDSDYDFGW